MNEQTGTTTDRDAYIGAGGGGMAMARSTDDDLKSAIDLCQIMQSLADGSLPDALCEDDESSDFFDEDDEQMCKRALNLLLDIWHSGIVRVVLGMAWLLDSRNKVINPNANRLMLHPRILSALKAGGAGK